jgi:hypothetical protein
MLFISIDLILFIITKELTQRPSPGPTLLFPSLTLMFRRVTAARGRSVHPLLLLLVPHPTYLLKLRFTVLDKVWSSFHLVCFLALNQLLPLFQYRFLIPFLIALDRLLAPLPLDRWWAEPFKWIFLYRYLTVLIDGKFSTADHLVMTCSYICSV